MDEILIELELSKQCHSWCVKGRLPHVWPVERWCRICGGSGVASTHYEKTLYPYVLCSEPAPYLGRMPNY